MYADDTNITTTGKSITETIQAANSDLENITEWPYANTLILNIAKTEQMFIASDMLNKIGDFTINTLAGEPIKRVRNSKSLGITIDERLSWSVHINAVAKKVSSTIGGLRQIRHLVDKETSITIYNSLIQPLFDYCDIVWDNIGSTMATIGFKS